MDIDCHYPHKYNVIFQDIQNNKLYEEKILPENLRNDYIVGNIYCGSKKELGDTLDINLNIRAKKVISNHKYKFKDIFLKDSSYDIGEYTKDFLNQECIFYEWDKIYLIPLYLIANRYYFLSTNVKKALSSAQFEEIFYPDTFKRLDNDSVEITVKHALNKNDIPLMVRMISNNYSRENFQYFFKQTSKKLRETQDTKNATVPIILGFPFCPPESFELDCKGISLGIICCDKHKTLINKEVCLITHIYADNIPYGFKNLKYTIFQRDKESVKKTSFPQEISGDSGDNSSSPSSSKRKSKKKYNNEPDNKNFQNLNISENIEIVDGIPLTFNIETGEFSDESPNKPSPSGNSNTREVLYDNNTPYDGFKIDDFVKLFEKLINDKNILESNLSEVTEFSNYENSEDTRFFLDNNKQYLRLLLYGYIQYKNLIINFIETQYNEKWEKGTWFLLSDKVFSYSDVQNILNDYIVYNINMKTLFKVNNQYSVIQYFYTRHTEINLKDKTSIKKWIKNVKKGIGKHFIS